MDHVTMKITNGTKTWFFENYFRIARYRPRPFNVERHQLTLSLSSWLIDHMALLLVVTGVICSVLQNILWKNQTRKIESFGQFPNRWNEAWRMFQIQYQYQSGTSGENINKYDISFLSEALYYYSIVLMFLSNVLSRTVYQLVWCIL